MRSNQITYWKSFSSVNEKEKSQSEILNRQRSSKSLRRHLSRQGTGKTLATDRCVTSPWSVQGNELR